MRGAGVHLLETTRDRGHARGARTPTGVAAESAEVGRVLPGRVGKRGGECTLVWTEHGLIDRRVAARPGPLLQLRVPGLS
jgi:hypothetical protein